jgi:hypothetical protein
MVAGISIVGGHWDLQSELGKAGIVYVKQFCNKYSAWLVSSTTASPEAPISPTKNKPLSAISMKQDVWSRTK